MRFNVLLVTVANHDSTPLLKSYSVCVYKVLKKTVGWIWRENLLLLHFNTALIFTLHNLTE